MIEIGEIIKQHNIWLKSEGEKGARANFSHADYKNIDLSGTDLRYSDISEAKFESTNFDDTNLTGACFAKSKIKYSSFVNSNLNKTDFSDSILENINFSSAKLNGSDFSRSKISKARLDNVKIKNIYMNSTTLEDISFNNSELLNSEFNKSSLSSCRFTNTILKNVTFDGAVMNRIDLSKSLILDTALNINEINNLIAVDAVIGSDYISGSITDNALIRKNIFGRNDLPRLNRLSDIRKFHDLQVDFVSGNLTIEEFEKRQAQPKSISEGISPLFGLEDATLIEEEKNIVPVTVFYATNRKSSEKNLPDKLYLSDRSEITSFGNVEVYIPDTHEIGVIEEPGFLSKIPFIGELIKAVNADKYFQMLSHMVFEDSDSFYKALQYILDKDKTLGSFVFIHGYNQTFSDAILRSAQLSYDLKLKLQPIVYSWPSTGKVLKGKLGVNAYMQDEEAAIWSQPHFAKFLTELSEKTGDNAIHLIAHSMGNRVMAHAVQFIAKENKSSAIKKKIKTIVIAAADIGVDIFKNLADEVKSQSDWVTIYSSKKDSILKVSEKLHNMPRLGNTDPLIIIKDMDNIDASNMDLTKFFQIGEHGHFAKLRPLLSDLYSLLVDHKAPIDRFELIKKYLNGEPYWVFRN